MKPPQQCEVKWKSSKGIHFRELSDIASRETLCPFPAINREVTEFTEYLPDASSKR